MTLTHLQLRHDEVDFLRGNEVSVEHIPMLLSDLLGLHVKSGFRLDFVEAFNGLSDLKLLAFRRSNL